MNTYDPKHIEQKWHTEWQKEGLYTTPDTQSAPKCYVLDMFPYPSGDGLHVGHTKGYVASDAYARFKRMNGYNVLHPMGWDAFGLPAENYAIKKEMHPREVTERNIAHFKEQLSRVGFSYDWDREINTTDPQFYKWTQWIFLKLYEHGLAYQSYESINWCPMCQTGLANEDLEGGVCERCDTEVEQRPMRQWMLRITDYAERLLYGLEALDWTEAIKEAQRNWIGKSEGATIKFPISDPDDHSVEVFTTRPDTIFGATYMVLAPEHELVDTLKNEIENWEDVAAYRTEVAKRTEIERTAEDKEKTGVTLEGLSAVNPATQESVPIFIADYVLTHYGTGAIMAVPAHDERDFAFAQKYDLPIREVVAGGDVSQEAYTGEGSLVNSGTFTGMHNTEAKQPITEHVGGEVTVTYKLRDWVFSRQRYWGEPIPIVHCEKCGTVPVPEEELPVELPDVEKYAPSGTGESPLATISEWVHTGCPQCGGEGTRETNTMPQWAGSSWYYLRYIDPHNDAQLVDPEKETYWSPVDVYVGGGEHATRHLVYARFWHMFLHDIGVVAHPEPFARLQPVGVVRAEDGSKMSKRYGNVIAPEDVIDVHGADTLRLYELFMGPVDQSVAWSTDGVVGPRRFLERVWRECTEGGEAEADGAAAEGADPHETEAMLHRTIKKVTDDIESFRFNTAIAEMMKFVNEGGLVCGNAAFSREVHETLTKLLAPFAPHIAEELWREHFGNAGSVHDAQWPQYDPEKIQSETVTVAVQVDGKVRTTITVDADADAEMVKKQAQEHPTIQKWIEDAGVHSVIYVPGKVVNIVTNRSS